MDTASKSVPVPVDPNSLPKQHETTRLPVPWRCETGEHICYAHSHENTEF